MRANHATKPQEPVPRGVTGARHQAGRWLPHTVAAGGALLAQLWGIGAPGAYAATADPLPVPPSATVRRALHGVPGHDGKSAGHPMHTPAPPAAPGLVGDLAGPGLAGSASPVSASLKDRIRAGGLPLPGQRAAVPDAFALASGLIGTLPARTGPTGARASREDAPTAPPTAPDQARSSGRAGSRGHPTSSAAAGRQTESPAAPPAQEAVAGSSAAAGSPDGGRGEATAAPTPGVPGAPEAVALADTATVTASADGSGTATAVLAPIAAGLLLTGAAMWKHRGLPSGH
ncbi:hypothetical protein F7Q99_08560 [Streptomyces kaniharaensis]|uniref:Uncharacterized protein n=1 Tax=Streptomyces kaniharaensis TaxID=212423 RepID=A0A6N7KPG0_9ACTN|nr:hypothetical protein [Streptomyces kaniharaensis]MQS12338.1 hypothetical protein [Streptomyces kaniharaensis]